MKKNRLQPPNEGSSGVKPPAGDALSRPSIGRIVNYITTDPDEQVNGAEIASATITGVRSDTVVNLKVTLDGPVPDRWIAGVPREHSFTPVDGFPVRFWRWPPRI